MFTAAGSISTEFRFRIKLLNPNPISKKPLTSPAYLPTAALLSPKMHYGNLKGK
ncbi:hypothetical protein [Alistipes sp. CAG:268]|uniref:hypothetical protein n=1 Tax=Alistipes sp. CAG:268 TaxID=1262693 RepID=UPI000A8471EB|nr:hypothetical protein [Alistipes sp. CAG:268]